MKLADWARSQGIRYHTAYKWFRDGTLPVPAFQTETGTILVTPAEPAGGGVVAVYARVSSAGQSDGLAGQVAAATEWATAQGLGVDRVVTEVGSALNGARRKFLGLLGDPSVGVIVAEHRGRVCRFGFEYVEAALSAHGRRLLVVDDGEAADVLERDMTEVLTSLCARLYGRRGAAKRAAAALRAARDVLPVGAVS